MTATDNENELHAPSYRYYLTDLLSGRILAEVPFSGVSYERAIKGAGTFSGELPVLDSEEYRSWDLYNSTMPGKTGLYVLRDDECVWGGMIWSRDYDASGKTLTVSGNEFTSYFHHRRIWKTWNHSYSAAVTSDNGVITVTFDDASEDLAPNSSVQLMWDSLNYTTELKYSGYYTVGEMNEEGDSFVVDGNGASASILSVERTGDWVTYYTSGKHGFNSFDEIVITMDEGMGADEFSGTFEISVPGGSGTSYFLVKNTAKKSDYDRRNVTGTAVRVLPNGTWPYITAVVRTDTYDYIRALINLVFEDFDSIDFADAYIEPGMIDAIDVTTKQTNGGIATITTDRDHNVIPGQSITLFSMGTGLNGEHVVYATPDTDRIEIKSGGDEPLTSIGPAKSNIIGRSAAHGVATLRTEKDHDFLIGDTISVDPGFDADLHGSVYAGTHEITNIPDDRTIRYEISSQVSLEYTDIPAPIVQGASGALNQITRRSLDSSGIAHLTTKEPHNLRVGQQVDITGLDYIVPVKTKSFDATSNIAIIDTGVDHHLAKDDWVEIKGVKDTVAISASDTGSGSTILYTKTAHNIRRGRHVTIDGMTDSYQLDKRQIHDVGGVRSVTLTTKREHNINNDTNIVVHDVWEYEDIKYKRIAGGLATITTETPHVFQKNDKVTIFGVYDQFNIGSKSTSRGKAVVILEQQHNFKVGQTIKVRNTGAPYDGDWKVTKVTDTRVYFNIKNKSNHTYTASRSGTVTGLSGGINGTHTVSAVTNDTIQFHVSANDMSSARINAGTVKGYSIINGRYKVNSHDSHNTLTYQLHDDEQTGPDQALTTIKFSPKAKAKKPVVTADGVLNGTHLVTKIGKNSFVIDQGVRNPWDKMADSGSAISSSIFSGDHKITRVTNTTFQFTLTVPKNNVSETTVTTKAVARSGSIFKRDGVSVVAVGADKRTLTYRAFSDASNHPSIPALDIKGWGSASRTPQVVVRSFGPYSSNADIGIEFSTSEYSGANVVPELYRGFQMQNVGEALDKYSDNIDGFEYRIDCDYDEANDRFTRTFVLIPINFPDPPAPGTSSLPSRFGADKLVFEFPGNISNVQMKESAENSATRFFAIGDIEDNGDAAQPYAVATATEMLSGAGNLDRWPLLDDDEKIKNIHDKTVLYSYAKRYLSEGRPPGISISIDVNGSVTPVVGSYQPGDWCSLIVNDEFIRQRLQSDLEPRNTVLVRKIESIKVDVPDGTAAPEKVTLGLVTEREVDTVGEQA